jgi:hypothetical protein
VSTIEADRTDEGERVWIRGHRAAWTSVLQRCLMELGYEDTEATRAKWILEREATVAALRSVCADHGDNDWDEHLHLADVIEKHLARHLEPSE